MHGFFWEVETTTGRRFSAGGSVLDGRLSAAKQMCSIWCRPSSVVRLGVKMSIPKLGVASPGYATWLEVEN
jgi:hypothetical protein